MQIIRAPPTVISAATTAMIKSANIWPSKIKDVLPSFMGIYRENATAVRITPLNINSKHIKIVIKLRLIVTPYKPMANNIDPTKSTELSDISIVHLFRIRDKAPIIADKSKIDAISNGKTYR